MDLNLLHSVWFFLSSFSVHFLFLFLPTVVHYARDGSCTLYPSSYLSLYTCTCTNYTNYALTKKLSYFAFQTEPNMFIKLPLHTCKLI